MRSEHTQLLTVHEASRLLKVTERTLHRYVQEGLLTAKYVKDKTSGQRSRRIPLNEVVALIDLGINEITLPRVANLALRALANSRDVSRRLGDIEDLLGIHTEALPTTEDGVIQLCIEAQGIVSDLTFEATDESTMRWSKILYAFTEEYLGLVHKFTASPEPWKVFMDLGDRIAESLKTVSHEHSHRRATVISYLDAARRQLRTVAYFYLRRLSGAHLAGTLFPEVEGGIDEEILGLLFQ